MTDVCLLTQRSVGLEAVLEDLLMRFEYDARGRIVGPDRDGLTPRFVLGRAAEGCVWRFAGRIEPELVRRVAKLAGREPGFHVDLGAAAVAPERWAAIERCFDPGPPDSGSLGRSRQHPGERAASTSTREVVTREGVVVGEIWLIH